MLPVLSDADVLALRPSADRPTDFWSPHAAFVERERSRGGEAVDVGTILLTNRECPYRCVMCDLWKYTTPERVPQGAVARQVERGLEACRGARQVKLYNAGSFFDAQAVPTSDLPRIAELVRRMEAVIVECHPALVGPRALELSRRIEGSLDIAMGLETIDPQVLPRLNKKMTLDGVRRAIDFCLGHGMQVRLFIILRLPGQSEEEGRSWALASIEWGMRAGAECCVVIPARRGNGMMEELERQGIFSPPSFESLEWVVREGIRLGMGRVFGDTWGLEPLQAQRIHKLNLEQPVA
jgi:radical SAM enzyme (TIGR01210 family)